MKTRRMMAWVGLVFGWGLTLLAGESSSTWDEDRRVWFTEPASAWRDGLPVGNGSLGAMVLGRYPKERIQLNHDRIWAKEPMLRHPKTTKDRIAEVQELVEAGKYREAQTLYESEIIMSEAPRIGSYQTLGDLWIEHIEAVPAQGQGYRRELDVETGLVSVHQPLSDGSEIIWQVLSSAPAGCVVIHLQTDAPAGLNFDLSLTRPFDPIVSAKARGTDTLVLDGQARYQDRNLPYLGTRFHTLLKVIPQSGKVTGGENRVAVRGARSAVLLLSCATDFQRSKTPREPLADGWQKAAEETLKAAQAKSWEVLREESASDVSRLMRRWDIDLGDSAAELGELPTDERLEAFGESLRDPDLMEIYLQFGRYLQVCSSRPGTLPTNLQGIWADGLKNPWDADYHLNINTQLHYLSTEPTQLSECHEPLFWLLDMLRVEGRKMAGAFGAEGFCTPHAVGPWGRAALTARRARWSASLTSVHWAAMNIMEHYRFTGDVEFLRERGFPILRESCEFVRSWLVRDAETGRWVPRAGSSPETGFIYRDAKGEKREAEIGPVTAYDQSIIWQVLSDYIKAAEVLEKENDFTASVKQTLKQLEKPRIGRDGRILEWGIETVQEVDPEHRHLSHLVGLHPGNRITQRKTPELFEAARKTLAARGNRTMGWSQSWKISLHARLQDGEGALAQFKQLLKEQTQPNLLNLAGKVVNLDGNYGAPAGVVEMLMQSHDGEVHLLPALPEEWSEGTVRGMMARGGFEVTIKWREGKLVEVEVISRLGNELRMRYGDLTRSMATAPGERLRFDASEFAD